jgi:TfoX/Sxy family transcriptional regulator of competence genes
VPADEETVRRVRALLAPRNDVSERRMFGGLAFMVSGNMLCAVGADHLMVRVGREQYEDALQQPHAGEMRFTGRAMPGYVTVDPGGYSADEALGRWVATALRFVTTLPPKQPAKR